MIKYNSNNISDWDFGTSNIVKVYHNNAVCYYKVQAMPSPSSCKWLATYSGGTTSSAECDSSSAITSGEIELTNLESVVIGDCVTSIGYGAFQSCTSLASVTIPSGVTSISSNAFYNCRSLTNCTIGDNVTNIDYSAFRFCSSLTSIDIPSGVTSIGNHSFRGCSGLTSITVEATTPPALGSYAFDNTNNCPIYVPSESVSVYQSAWSTYASRIQAIP